MSRRDSRSYTASLVRWCGIADMINGNRSITFDEIRNVVLKRRFTITKYDKKKREIFITRNDFIADINWLTIMVRYVFVGPISRS